MSTGEYGSAGKSVEERFKGYADKADLEIRGKKKGCYPFIEERKLWILEDLPRVVGSEPSQSLNAGFRIDELTGAIYTSRWKPLRVKDSKTGETKMVRPKNSVNILDLREPNNNTKPEDIPLSLDPELLELPEFWEGIEHAIRGQQHVIDKHDKLSTLSDPQKLSVLIAWVDDVSVRLKAGLGQESLSELRSEAADKIKKAGFGDSTDYFKQRINSLVLEASEKDSLGRPNPLVSRTKLGSAYLAASIRLVISDLIQSKYSDRMSDLISFREFTRGNLELALGGLDLFSKYDYALISEEERFFMANQIDFIVGEYLSKIKIAPYLLPSKLATMLLVDSTYEEMGVNSFVLGEDLAKELYYSQSAQESLLKGDRADTESEQSAKEFTIARDNIKWASNMIRQALEFHTLDWDIQEYSENTFFLDSN